MDEARYQVSKSVESLDLNSHVALQRTISDPEFNQGLGVPRTHSNASQCSRSRTSSRLYIGLHDGPRPRATSKRSPAGSVLPQTDSPSIDEKTLTSGSDSSGIGSDISVPNGHVNTPIPNGPVYTPSSSDDEIRKAQAFEKLRQELERAQLQLRRRDEECKRLSRVRDDLDNEVEELTASLFQEAHVMVREANVKQASAENQLKEAKLKLDGLQAEVSALKLLVLTSTPSNPGKRGHRRVPSADQICTECGTYHCVTDEFGSGEDGWAVVDTLDKKEVDRLTYRDFVSWLEHRCPLDDHPFLNRIYDEDISPCLRFPNQELANQIHTAVKNNTLIVESLTGKSKSRKCSLTKGNVPCPFRIRLSDDGEWHFISAGCRQRIVAVANFYTYIRYIQLGLIRNEVSAKLDPVTNVGKLISEHFVSMNE